MMPAASTLLTLLLVSGTTGGADAAARRVGWWWDAPATAADPSVDAMLGFAANHSRIVSSVLIRDANSGGPGGAPGPFGSSLRSHCGI
jgi:hypothetical protein